MKKEPTDKDMTILCGECVGAHIEQGLEAMKDHIRIEHPTYNEHEVDVYATAWLEDAWDRWDAQREAYENNQKAVNAIRRQTGEW